MNKYTIYTAESILDTPEIYIGATTNFPGRRKLLMYRNRLKLQKSRKAKFLLNELENGRRPIFKSLEIVEGRIAGHYAENFWIDYYKEKTDRIVLNQHKSDISVPILQYDLQGNFIARYSSPADVRVSLDERCAKNIRNVITGHCNAKTAYGFLWRKQTTTHIPLTIDI